MHRARSLLGIGTLLTVVACADAPTGSTPHIAIGPPGRYMVTLRDDIAAGGDVADLSERMAMTYGVKLVNVRQHAARGFTALVTEDALRRLSKDSRVLILEPDGVVQLDLPRETAGPPSGGGGQQTSYGLARVGGSFDGTGKTAWIIDTGIDLDHPDLNTSRACHANFVRQGADQTGDDGNGHGTHVSGIIAARNNSIGTLGIAANAFVCSVRVLNNAGSGQWTWIIDGVDYVAANGVSGEVANMSLGGSGANATLEKAVQDASARVKFALAAGNDGANANNFTPARVNGANIYTVSAIGSNDCMPSWSNYGNPPVDYAAPGVSILSLYKGGGTRTLSGTSMASPHVAGILLGGSIRGNGTACSDPDGNPDPIAHR
jgi:subtilisin family serine protease